MRNLLCFVCYGLDDALKYSGWTNNLDMCHRYFLFIGDKTPSYEWKKNTDYVKHIKNLSKVKDYENIVQRYFMFFTDANYTNIIICHSIKTTNINVIKSLFQDVYKHQKPITQFNILAFTKEYLLFNSLENIKMQSLQEDKQLSDLEIGMEIHKAAQGQEVGFDTLLQAIMEFVLVDNIMIHPNVNKYFTQASIIQSYSKDRKSDCTSMIMEEMDNDDFYDFLTNNKGLYVMVISKKDSPLRYQTTPYKTFICKEGWKINVYF
jgi:hypothetical protein